VAFEKSASLAWLHSRRRWPEGLDDLVKKMKRTGVPPILTRPDGYILDGVRRVAGAQLLGRDVLEAVVAENMFEAAMELKTRRGDREYSNGRIVDIIRSLREMQTTRREERVNANLIRASGLGPEAAVQGGTSRVILAEATDLPVGSIEYIVRLIKLADDGDEIAAEVISGFEEGVSVYTSWGNYLRRTGDGWTGDVIRRTEQLGLLTSAATNLNAVTYVLQKMGKPTLNAEEMSAIYRDLYIARAKLSKFMNKLLKESQASG
jgi:hypothetical protein